MKKILLISLLSLGFSSNVMAEEVHPLDFNEDGIVTKEERQEFRDTFDVDGNGELSTEEKSELREVRKKRREARKARRGERREVRQENRAERREIRQENRAERRENRQERRKERKEKQLQ